MVGVAGAPGSGKSTFAAKLVDALSRLNNVRPALLPMDAFHIDDRLLIRKGLIDRKGSPETFDVQGFLTTLDRLLERHAAVYIPSFERTHEASFAAAEVIEMDRNVVVVEGNYLLLDEKPWSELANFFEVCIYLETPLETLRARLKKRWLSLGYDEEHSERKVTFNDLRNAERVIAHLRQADWIISQNNPND